MGGDDDVAIVNARERGVELNSVYGGSRRPRAASGARGDRPAWPLVVSYAQDASEVDSDDGRCGA